LEKKTPKKLDLDLHAKLRQKFSKRDPMNHKTAEPIPFFQRKSSAEWLEILSHRRASERRQAALALGQLPEKSLAILNGLIKALTDSNELVRRQAAESLGAFGPAAKAAVPQLALALNDSWEFIRQQAADTLGRIGPDARAAVSALVQALKDPVKYVRWQAADALGKIGIGSKSVIKGLLDRLLDDEEDVRSASARSLSMVHPEVVRSLAKALTHADPQLRGGAAQALGEMGEIGVKALPALKKALKDPNLDVRARVARTLGELAPFDAHVLDALVLALEDDHLAVRREAAEAICQPGHNFETVSTLYLQLLNDTDPEIRTLGSLALSDLGEQSIPLLIRALTHKNPRVAAGARQGLMELPTLSVREAELPYLQKALKSTDPGIRAWSARALGTVGPGAGAAVVPLTSLLQDPDDNVRVWAVRSLGKIGPGAEKALPSLRKLLDLKGIDYREDVKEAIKKIETRPANKSSSKAAAPKKANH
jgi:HEAT repeat protein